MNSVEEAVCEGASKWPYVEALNPKLIESGARLSPTPRGAGRQAQLPGSHMHRATARENGWHWVAET